MTKGKDVEVGKSTRVTQMEPNLIILAALKSAQTLPAVVRETDVTTISSDPRQILQKGQSTLRRNKEHNTLHAHPLLGEEFKAMPG